MHHEGVAVAPRRQELVHVDEGGEETEGEVEDGLVAVEVNEERGLGRSPGEAALAGRHEPGVSAFVEDGGERGGGAVELRELQTLVASPRVELLAIASRSRASMASTARA